MSVTTSEALYGIGYGRGDLEQHVIQTLQDWIVPYIADYERQKGLTARSLPVPPTPQSIHGGIDFTTFSSELMPEIIVVAQPRGDAERSQDGTYGSWYTVEVGAIVYVEGDQDRTRLLADAYGTALEKLIPQQGAWGQNPDGEPFATRTRLRTAYGVVFPDVEVRDIVRATVGAETFVWQLVSDFIGPLEPPADPYAVPLPIPAAAEIEVNLIRGLPGDSGELPADAVVLDNTVYPPVVRYEEVTVDVPSD